MNDLNHALEKEANVLPEKQKKYTYTYLLLKKDKVTEQTVLIQEFASRTDVTAYLSSHLSDMEQGLFCVYRTTGTLPLKVKKEVQFEL